MSTTTVVTATGLAAAYGRRKVWEGASFEIASSELVGVLGPNGAGKSTLLRLLLGLQDPVAGALSVLGGPPARGSSLVGYLPQRRDIDPELRVEAAQLVRLGLDGHRWGLPAAGRRGREARRAVAAALAAVGASELADRAAGSLSGGELQRVLLAQALVCRPRLVLLDEPLANLDVAQQGAMVALLAQLARTREMSVLLVAHDVNPLLPSLDRVVYVAGGRVAAGPPSEVITAPSLSAIYGAPVEVLTDSRGRVFVAGLEGVAGSEETLGLQEAQR
ncbi:MAG: metal ABC transporter ATP-binding protein [Acidimicrobiales bacterium]